MPIPLAPGGKFYFPNIIFRFVRSNLPPHQAVFRCPQQLNKLDIKSYLSNLYNLSITDVRTMNYIGTAVRRKEAMARQGRQNARNFKLGSYKKVIVSMEEDFVFPDQPDVKLSGGMRMPPRVSFGKSSANRGTVRKQIEEQALERGVDLETTQTTPAKA
eukprot:jgi/Hompol1/3559/HPOL_003287-RA